jgi:hypothetical protein
MSSNGPCTLLLFMKNNSFLICKDPAQGSNLQEFINKFNKDIFKNRKFVFHKKY